MLNALGSINAVTIRNEWVVFAMNHQGWAIDFGQFVRSFGIGRNRHHLAQCAFWVISCASVLSKCGRAIPRGLIGKPGLPMILKKLT